MLVVFLLLCLLAQGLRRYRERYGEGELRLTFFDVGQGDAALVEFPGGKRMLIDSGGGFADFDLGSRVLVGELTRKSILRLDYAVLTHPDQDHGYGFRGVFAHLQVNELWFHRFSPKPLFDELTRLAAAKGSRLRPFVMPEREDIGGVRVEAVPLSGPGSSTNDHPLVIFLEYAGCRALFTADIEREGERELAARYAEADVTILKVPHHGSHTSSGAGFLRRVRPRFAVLSAGMGNRYGHPHSEVVERYRDLGVPLFRTDFHGFVEMVVRATGEIFCRTSHGTCGTTTCASPGTRPRIP